MIGFTHPDFNDRVKKPETTKEEPVFPNQEPIEVKKQNTEFVWPETQPEPVIEEPPKVLSGTISNTITDEKGVFCICGHNKFSHIRYGRCINVGCYGPNLSDSKCNSFISRDFIDKNKSLVIEPRPMPTGITVRKIGDVGDVELDLSRWEDEGGYSSHSVKDGPIGSRLKLITKDGIVPDFCGPRCRELYHKADFRNADWPYKIIDGVMLTRPEMCEKLGLCSYCLEPLDQSI